MRRVWAPTIGEALEAMVADRRTDETLEQIEQGAVADGALWPDAVAAPGAAPPARQTRRASDRHRSARSERARRGVAGSGAQMQQIEILIGLLAGVAVLAALAERAGLPYPAILVLGGLALGLIPGRPEVRLQPQLVLLGFLPPLVYAAAFRAASFDLRSNLAHILTLADRAGAPHRRRGGGRGPGDDGAAVGQRPGVGGAERADRSGLGERGDPAVGAPERIVAILEGESLINDGTGLAAFQVATAAAAGGITVGGGALKFVEISVGGCAVGLVVGWLARAAAPASRRVVPGDRPRPAGRLRFLRRRLRDRLVRRAGRRHRGAVCRAARPTRSPRPARD